MAKRDYYEVLGVNKNSTQDEIKKAYRKKSMEHHPDKGGDEEVFKEIAEAYDTLSDQEKKEKYDVFGHNAPKGNQGGGFNPFDAFSDLFGGGGFNPFGRQQQQQRQRRGQDLNLTVKLTLEEIFNGTTKRFRFRRNESCSTCSGKGGTGKTTCARCQGAGMVNEIINTPIGQIRNTAVCNACEGEGYVVETACTACNSSGVKPIDETVDINIPHGVIDGLKMAMGGKGNAIKNGIPGDLIITMMELPHETFVRTSNDLVINVNLTYPQLVLGDKIEIPTIEGTKIRITVPEYTKVGDRLRIQNKGLKQLNTNNRGDMNVVVDLYIPKEITPEERDLIEKLKKINEKVATT